MNTRKDSYDVSSEKKGNNSDKIKSELEKLSKKGIITSTDIAELNRKYKGDPDIINEIVKRNAKRYSKIRKQAKEAARQIHSKFASGTRPFHEILDRIMKYKIKQKWSDAEYDEFKKELSHLLTGRRAMEIDYNPNLLRYRSKISSALGSVEVVDTGLNIKESEHKVLNEILSLFESTSSLHRSVFMNSLMYDDCSLVATTGKYKGDTHIASNHIHPVLACLYLPKLDIFEIHTLYANFGSIIKC